MEYMITHTIKGEKDHHRYLYSPCGKDIKQAERILDKILNHPDAQNLKDINEKGYQEFQIDTVEDKNCWWNDPFLCN